MKQNLNSIRGESQTTTDWDEIKNGTPLGKSIAKRLITSELKMDFQKVIDDLQWLVRVESNQNFDVLRRYRLFCDALMKDVHHEEAERIVHKYGVTFRNGRVEVGEGLKKNGGEE